LLSEYRRLENSAPWCQVLAAMLIFSSCLCLCDLSIHIVARIVWRLYKTGYWIDNWIYWITHTVTVYKLHNSLLQLQLFSEGCCSARILTRNSLSKPHPRTPSAATWLSVYSLGADHKENTSLIPLLLNDVITGADRKENAGRFHCCVAWQRLVNKRLTVDC
jgi:hypothetical protein